MKPEEYYAYFEGFIFNADKEFGQKNPFALVSKLGLGPKVKEEAKRQPKEYKKILRDCLSASDKEIGP